MRVQQPRHGFIKEVVRGAWWDRWRAGDKDEGRMEGERRELPPLVISARKGGLAWRSGNHRPPHPPPVLFLLNPSLQTINGDQRHREMKVCEGENVREHGWGVSSEEKKRMMGV